MRVGWAWVGFATLLAAAGCRSQRIDLAPPALIDPYSVYLSKNLGTPGPLEPCSLRPIDLGPTESSRFKRLRLELDLPTTFLLGPRELLVDSLRHPAMGRTWGANGWLPGLYVQPVWYRWTRADPGVAVGANAPTTLLQLTQARGYAAFQADAPWTMSESEECSLTLSGRTARVLRFTLRHPTVPPQWGLAAFWRGRPDDGWISVLGLGSDPATQGEFLEIIRRHRP